MKLPTFAQIGHAAFFVSWCVMFVAMLYLALHAGDAPTIDPRCITIGEKP